MIVSSSPRSSVQSQECSCPFFFTPFLALKGALSAVLDQTHGELIRKQGTGASAVDGTPAAVLDFSQ